MIFTITAVIPRPISGSATGIPSETAAALATTARLTYTSACAWPVALVAHGSTRYPAVSSAPAGDSEGPARFLARHFTRKPRTADHAPGLPGESNARARQKRSVFGSDAVENCEAVKAVWFTTVVENVFDVLT